MVAPPETNIFVVVWDNQKENELTARRQKHWRDILDRHSESNPMEKRNKHPWESRQTRIRIRLTAHANDALSFYRPEKGGDSDSDHLFPQGDRLLHEQVGRKVLQI